MLIISPFVRFSAYALPCVTEAAETHRLPFVAVAYSPEAHGAFVRSTFALGALRDGSRAARERLDALLRLPGSSAILAHLRGDPDRFAGWAARTKHELIFAFVLPVMRRRGLGSELLRELGFDGKTAPIPVRYWTPSAQAIAAAGRRWIYHAVYETAAAA